MSINDGLFGKLRRIAALILAVCGAAAGQGSLFEIDSAQIAGALDTYFQQAQQAVVDHNIRLARQQISLVSFKMDKYTSGISKTDKKAYDIKLQGLKTSIKRLVDSLVQVNISIIKNNGQAAGIDFRRECAAAGLSEIELASVDEAIVNAGAADERPQAQPAVRQEAAPVARRELSPPAVKQPPQPQRIDSAEKRDNAPGPEKNQTAAPAISRVEPAMPVAQPFEPKPSAAVTEEKFPAPLPEMPAAAASPHTRDAAQSVSSFSDADAADRGKAMAQSNTAKINVLLNENKAEEARIVFRIYQENLRQFLSPQDFQRLQGAVDAAYSQDQNHRSRAAQIIQTIDDLVDQDHSAEAFALFREKREDLKVSMSKEEIGKLETKVGRAYVEFGKAQGAANAKAREIHTLIADQKVEEAAASFEKTRVQLQRCLSKEMFEELLREVYAAISAIKDQKKQTTVCIRDIRSLIEEGKGLAASSKYAENTSLLQRNMDEQGFSRLTAEVNKAKNEYFARQAKAQADLTRIDSLIANKRIESAYAAFEKSKDDLRSDLADDKRFFDFKNRIVKAYDEMNVKRKKALRSLKSIETLVKHEQGLEAHITFQLDADVLREYLEAQPFKKLEEGVQRAYLDYESNVAAARLIAQDIDALLAKRQFEQAFEAYKRAEETFQRFLENDKAIDDLEKKVKQANGQYQKKKRWAAAFIRQIQWLMDNKQGDQALNQLKKARPELTLYVEPKQLMTLDSAVARANRKFLTDKALAEKNAGRVRALIDQKRFENAYSLFKSLRQDLETYLSENTFNTLRNEVTNAREEYEGKKKKAEAYAKELNALVDRKKLPEARTGFQANRVALKQYLNEQDFRKLEKKIMRKSSDAKTPPTKRK